MIEILKTVLAWWFLWVAIATLNTCLVFMIGMMFMGDDEDDK